MKFLSLGTKTMLQKCENIFLSGHHNNSYAQHDVEERIGNDEIESDGYYEVVNLQSKLNSPDEDDNIEKCDSTGDDATFGNFDTTCVSESILKYKIMQGHRKKLYSAETSLR